MGSHKILQSLINRRKLGGNISEFRKSRTPNKLKRGERERKIGRPPDIFKKSKQNKDGKGEGTN